jgi:hypothetical protein
MLTAGAGNHIQKKIGPESAYGLKYTFLGGVGKISCAQVAAYLFMTEVVARVLKIVPCPRPPEYRVWIGVCFATLFD